MLANLMDTIDSLICSNEKYGTSKNGGFPVAISIIVHPSDQISAYINKNMFIRLNLILSARK